MHLALARKYRPQTFAEVVGQEHVTRTLQNALTGARLHHAYLFCGARGVGKTTVARLLAKAVNCAGRGTGAEPCNTCPSCLDITEGRSLDVQEIDGASNTGVDDVREIREFLKYLPTGEHYKIYVIDEVHMLSTAAFNALLKTLEEPPPHALFVFATTEPQKIPATILSRCQRYDFRRVSGQRIVETLRDIAAREGFTVEPEVLQLLAIESEGSLRDAESLLDQAVAFAGTAVTVDQLRALLGFTDRTTLRGFVEAIVARDAAVVLERLEEVYQSGGNVGRLTQELLEQFRHLWVIASCGKAPTPESLPHDDLMFLESLAQRFTVAEWQQWFTVLYQGISDVAQSRWPKLAMEALLLRMVQVEPITAVGTLIERVERWMGAPEAPVASRSTAMPVTKAAASTANKVAPVSTDPLPRVERQPSVVEKKAAPSTTVSPPVVREQPLAASQPSPVPASADAVSPWSACVAWLQANRPQLASILEHGTVVRADTELVELTFPKDSVYAEMLKEPRRLEQLTAVLQQRLGPRCQLRVTQTDGPSLEERRTAHFEARTQQQRAATEAALQNPLIQDAARILGAEVKEVKVLTS